jgi:alpha-galactosidase
MHKQRIRSLPLLSSLLILFLLFSGAVLFNAQVSQAYAAAISGLAPTPPMGWNSWNKFGCNVNESIIKQEADAMASNGMKAAGYQYINIDDCWESHSRDSSGNLVADPNKFPDGIKALATYVHGKGLKLGIYNDAGTATCAGYPGFEGHEQQDANIYASWGIDYIKVDWCNTTGLDPQTQYTKISNALQATGRPIVLSLCSWGNGSPWLWGASIANLWRTTGDISDNWSSMLSNFDSNSTHASYAKPGGWNDPDMLEVGNGGMSTAEDQAHFSLWAISAAPLITGNDLANMSSTTASILTNSEVIAVDQDSAGVQGTKVADNGAGQQVWAKRLSGNGNVAVALLNRGSSTSNITVNWSSIGLSGNASVRDLWAHADRGTFTNSYTASVPSHSVVMLKITAGSGGSTPTPTPTASGSGHYYKLVNRNSGLVLDISGGSTANGGQAIQWPYSGGANQQWQEVPVNGGYKLVNRNSGLVLDDPGGSKSNGTQLDQWADTNGSNQWWNLLSAGNGYYYLVNQSSGLYADVSGASTTQGAAVIQWPSDGGTNQQWQLVAV